MGEMVEWSVRVWHVTLEVAFTFSVHARTDQRALIGAREMFSREQISARVLRVQARPAGEEHDNAYSSWEPL